MIYVLQESSELNSTLQVTMQPDGSFLCFGNSECNKESTLSNPTVEVNIFIYFADCCKVICSN